MGDIIVSKRIMIAAPIRVVGLRVFRILAAFAAIGLFQSPWSVIGRFQPIRVGSDTKLYCGYYISPSYSACPTRQIVLSSS
jgi:hypothetical protein